MKQTKMQVILKTILCAYLIVGFAGILLFQRNSIELLTNDTSEEEELAIIDREDASTDLVSDDTDDEEYVNYADDEEDVIEEDLEEDEEDTDIEADDADVEEDLTEEDLSANTDTAGYIGTVEIANTVRALNLRTGPGKNYSIIGEYKQGQTLYLIEEDKSKNAWSKVTDGTTEGYMSTQYLKVTLY